MEFRRVLFRSDIRPHTEFFQDPCSNANRAVAQRDAKRLRARSLQMRISGFPSGESRAALRPRQFFRFRRHRVFRLDRSEEHTSELQSLMRISYAVFCLKKKHHIEPRRKVTIANIK